MPVTGKPRNDPVTADWRWGVIAIAVPVAGTLEAPARRL
jgi:hypothetical protein